MYKTVIGKLMYDINTEEGELEFSESFQKEDWVFKADLLVDWINELQTVYVALMQEKPEDLQ